MSVKSSAFRACTAFLFVVSLTVGAFADTIRLKDGGIVKGKIVGFASGRFTVSVGEGTRKKQVTFAAADIESIDFEAPRPGVPMVSASVVKPAERTTPPVSTPVQKDEPVVVADEDTDEPASTPPAGNNRKASFAKPIELSVKVLADNTANGWTNSGWVVKKGQRIRISGSGEVSIGRGKKTSASGLYDLDDPDKLLKSVPTGALIAVIGDDNNDFIYVGSDREFTASRDGALFLGLNEGNLADNSGAFDVKIAITPGDSE